MQRLTRSSTLFLLSASLAGAHCAAQNTNAGDIRGIVTDNTGAVIPGATVTVLDLDKGVTTTYITNHDGLYDTGPIVNDTYKLTFTKAGFASFVRESITLQVGTVTVSARLKPGDVTQEVVVTDDLPLLETETGAQSATLGYQEMAQLPNAGLAGSTPDWRNFVRFIPGATGTSTASTDSGDSYSVNGNLPFNQVLSDGASSMLTNSGNADVTTFETVQEVQVNDNAFSAQYGVGGVLFNQISKGGGRQFHGSLYEYLQNDAFNARNYFQTSKPYLRFDDFGGTVSGPVPLPGTAKNKAFFFFNVDHIVNLSAVTGYATVPTLAERNGDFTGFNPIYDPTTTTTATTGGKSYIKRTQFTNNKLSAIDPVAAKIQALLPMPNYAGPQLQVSTTTGITSNNFYYNWKGTAPYQKYFGRFDYDIKPTNRLTASVTERSSPALYVGALGCPLDCVNGNVSSYNAQITDVWTITPHTVNELRFGYTNQLNFFSQQTENTGIGSQLGLQFLKYDIIPTLNISSYTGISSPFTPYTYKEHTFDPSDVVTLIRGRHVIHFGGEYMMLEGNSTVYGNINGATLGFTGVYTQCSYCQTAAGGAVPSTGNAYADFLTGSIQNWSAAVSPEYASRQKYPQAFVQDDWKLAGNFTLNLGVRYEIMEGFSDNHGNQRTFDPTVSNSLTGTLGGMWYASTQANGRKQLQNNVFDTVMPRVGFAWQFRPGFVLRGGWGLYSYPWSLDTYGYDEGTAFGSKGNLTDATNGMTPIGSLSGANPQFPYVANSTDSGAYNGQSVNYTDVNTPTAKVQQFNLSLEQAIGANMSVSFSYVGNYSKNLNFNRDINQVPASALAVTDQQFRPYPQFSAISGSTFNADSNYNSGQVVLKRRVNHGLGLQANYVWSKFLDEYDSSAWGSRNGTTTYQSSYDVGANYGPANFDVRTAFKGYLTYELPFGHGRQFLNKNYLLDEAVGGWLLSSTFQLQTGTPFTVTVPTNLGQSYAQSGNVYPNYLMTPRLSNRSITHWANSTYINQNGVKVGPDAQAAYSIAPNGAFGNQRRNDIYGPGIEAFNVSLGKTFAIYKDHVKFHFQSDIGNVLNHPSFANVSSTSLSNASFGVITSNNRYIGGRAIQLLGRLTF